MEKLKPCPFCGGRAENKAAQAEVWNRRNKETTDKQEADELIRTLIKGEECNPCEWCHTPAPDNTDNGGVCEGCCLYEDNDDFPCKFTAFSHKPDKNI
jgi:hypothetical protein